MEQASQSLIAEVFNGRTTRRPNLSNLGSLGQPLASALVSSYNDFCARYKTDTHYQGLRTVLNALGKYCEGRYIVLDTPRSCHDFLHGFRTYWYTTDTLTSNSFSRNDRWMIFRQFIEFSMKEGILPETAIPPGNPKLNNHDVRRNSNLIQVLKLDDPVDSSTVVTISLARSDDKYLDELYQQFIDAREAFVTAARREIGEIRSNYLRGKELAASVDWDDLRSKIDTSIEAGRPYRERTGRPGPSVHMFGNNHPRYVENVLCYIYNQLDVVLLGQFRCGLSGVTDPAMKYVHHTVGKSPRIPVLRQDEMSGYLGRLTSRMAAPFFVLLLIKNPKFRISSLLDVEIEEKNGISKLMSSAGEDGSAIRATTDKRRAHAEKSEVLDSESLDALNLLIELTTPFRNYLKHQGNPNYKKLWLALAGGKGFTEPRWLTYESLANVFGIYAHKIHDKTLDRIQQSIAENSFLNSHPELAPYIGNVTLKKLPTIGGIITWFDSLGDVDKAARTLGNQKKMCMNAYIPKPIQLLMNLRMIRRFQNLLICAATAGKDCMLEASDFITLDELHEFLVQMLIPDQHKDAQDTKTIKAILKRKLDIDSTPPLNTVIGSGGKDKQIRVSISEQSLVTLFLYEEHIDASAIGSHAQHEENTPNSPLFWKKLSMTLRRLLPECKTNRELSVIYKKALESIEYLRGKVTFPSIETSHMQAIQ